LWYYNLNTHSGSALLGDNLDNGFIYLILKCFFSVEIDPLHAASLIRHQSASSNTT